MMTLADLIAAALIRAEAAGSLAILLVLALRLPVRRLFGPEQAWRLWTLPPTLAVISLFPTFAEFAAAPAAADQTAVVPNSALLLLVWTLGAVTAALVLAASEAAFRRRAARGLAGPAVMGVFWPRQVTPADFAERFTPSEQALVRKHESTHIALGHPMANLVIGAMQVVSWFNPLVHLAAASARLDQELACDAVVMASAPGARRLYGETLLKAHMAPSSPFACALSGLGRHPLETRLATLRQPQVTLALYLRGAVVVALAGIISAATLWSIGPRWSNTPPFDWPPAAHARFN